MRCLTCGFDTSVIDSRKTEDGSIHRRRQCKKCGARFSTLEVDVLMLTALLDTMKFVKGMANIIREVL